MSVQRYRRKPVPTGQEELFAARYEPGQPLADLLAVARMADSGAQVAEVTFPSATTVLLVRWKRIPDGHPAETEHEVIEPGDYLAFSRPGWHLYATDDADLRQFYELAAGQ